jgi:hypothetical protein
VACTHGLSTPLEPVISDASTVARQVLERIQPIEVIDRDLRDRFGLGQPKVYRDTAAPVFVFLVCAPEGDTAADQTKVELDRRASHVPLGLAENSDALIFVVIGPEHAVAATHGAVASGCPVRLAVKVVEPRRSGRSLGSSRYCLRLSA